MTLHELALRWHAHAAQVGRRVIPQSRSTDKSTPSEVILFRSFFAGRQDRFARGYARCPGVLVLAMSPAWAGSPCHVDARSARPFIFGMRSPLLNARVVPPVSAIR